MIKYIFLLIKGSREDAANQLNLRGFNVYYHKDETKSGEQIVIVSEHGDSMNFNEDTERAVKWFAEPANLGPTGYPSGTLLWYNVKEGKLP